MSETQHNTVFISYRRDMSSFIARAIFLDLRARGYDVFMDVDSIDNGMFDTIILKQIALRDHFLVVLSPGSLDHISEPNDWLRSEIERAIDLQRNIVPILVNGFSFENAKSSLTGKLSVLPSFNAITVSHEYFAEAMGRLQSRYLRSPVAVEKVQPFPVEEPTLDNQPVKPSQERKKQVFLSHSTKDHRFVDQLAHELRQNGLQVWKAPESIQPGETWMGAVQNAIKDSTHFVLIISPNSVASKMVMLEADSALNLNTKGKIEFIPVEYQHCEDIPIFWETFHWISFSIGHEELVKGLLLRLSN